MTLLLSMLPLYLIGNFHCMGMCGPLVLMIGKHRQRLWYFAGRTLSFTGVACLAGGFGSVLGIYLHEYKLSALIALVFGIVFMLFGILKLSGIRFYIPLPKQFGKINKKVAGLMLQDTPWHTFLFGLSTVLLPCGQTMLVFSACALAGDPLVGALNGFVFALLTSPSLWLSMHAHKLLAFGRDYYNTLLGVCAIFVGLVAFCRGLAELDIIDHLVLSADYHIVVF